MNIAEYQSILSRQYLPVTVGEPLPPYVDESGKVAYNESINPGVDLFFGSASFRYAHPEFRGYLPRLDAELKEIPQGGVNLRTAFFNSVNHYIEDPEYGIYNKTVGDRVRRFGPAVVQLFRGLSHTVSGKVQPTLTDEMRNWVFSSSPTAAGIDLISVGIQMGREQDLGTYNDARRAFGLAPATTWNQVTSDVNLQDALARSYNSVADIDAWVGVLAEDTAPGAVVGPLARLSLLDQFSRSRNADRFWYENTNFFSPNEIQTIHGVTLHTLLERIYPKQLLKVNDGSDSASGDQFAPSAFFLPARQLVNYGSASRTFYPSPPIAVDSTLDLSPSFRLSWKVNWANNTLSYVLQGKFFGWMGVGLSPEKNSMKGADIVLCRFLPQENGNVSNLHECRDSFALDVGPPVLDTAIGGTDDIQYSYARKDGEFQTFVFVKSFNSSDRWDKPLSNNTDHAVIFAFNPTTYELRYHGPTRSPDYKIRFLDDSSFNIRSEPIPSGVSAVIGIVAAIGGVVGVFMIILVAAKKDYFRYQETVFCQLILFGTIVGYMSAFVNLVPVATAATCIANLWLLHLSYVFVVGCLFVKTWRMWRLLDLSTMQVLKITRFDMLRLVVVYLIAEAAVLLAWSLVDPPLPRPFLSDSTSRIAMLGCQQQNDAWWFVTMGVKFVFLAFGTFLSIKNRNHAPIFNDSKSVGISTYILFITMLIVGTIGIALRQFVVAVLIVKSFGIVIPYAIITLVLFSGTCAKIFTGQEAEKSLTYVKRGSSTFGTASLSTSVAEGRGSKGSSMISSAPDSSDSPRGAKSDTSSKPKTPRRTKSRSPREDSPAQQAVEPSSKPKRHRRKERVGDESPAPRVSKRDNRQSTSAKSKTKSVAAKSDSSTASSE